MSYQYDIFFSYKRDPESDAWHQRVSEKIRFWVRQELARDVQVFFDTHDILTGDEWKRTLVDALRKSRCLLCLWSPSYFQSRWCVSEWRSFLQREQQFKKSLIAPASYFDGENFPAEARQRNFVDFSEFASTLPRFWDTDSAVRFEQERLRSIAHDIARMINDAPPFNEAFPLHEAIDDEVVSHGPIGRIADV